MSNSKYSPLTKLIDRSIKGLLEPDNILNPQSIPIYTTGTIELRALFLEPMVNSLIYENQNIKAAIEARKKSDHRWEMNMIQKIYVARNRNIKPDEISQWINGLDSNKIPEHEFQKDILSYKNLSVLNSAVHNKGNKFTKEVYAKSIFQCYKIWRELHSVEYDDLNFEDEKAVEIYIESRFHLLYANARGNSNDKKNDAKKIEDTTKISLPQNSEADISTRTITAVNIYKKYKNDSLTGILEVDTALSGAPEHEMHILYIVRAIFNTKISNYEGALNDATAAKNCSSDNIYHPILNILLGNSHFYLSNNDDASNCFTKAIQISTTNSLLIQVYLLRGWAKIINGGNPNACKLALLDFKAIYELDKANCSGLVGQGIASWQQGLFEEAEKYFTLAINHNPNSLIAYYHRYCFYIALYSRISGFHAKATSDFSIVCEFMKKENIPSFHDLRHDTIFYEMSLERILNDFFVL